MQKKHYMQYTSSRNRFCPIVSALLTLALVAPASAQVKFKDVTADTGVEYSGESYGASWGYANDDPLPDLYVSHHRNRPSLYINLGNGKFEDRTNEVDAWQLTPRSDTHGGTFADFNNDGFNDLMIAVGASNKPPAPPREIRITIRRS